MRRVDIVVAVRNEEQNIPVFLEGLSGLRFPPETEVKVVFVEDSSTDGTRPLLRRLAGETDGVGYYMLARGYGQGVAVVFGVSRSTADAMVMMDVDGGHPVEVLPEMVRQYLDGAQVVQCVRNTLAERKAYRDLGAFTFAVLARLVTGIDTREQNILFRLISAEVARELLCRPRYWRWLRFPLPRRPDGVLRKIYVDSRERVLGESKYGVRRLVHLAIDGILSLISPTRLVVLLLLMAAVAIVLGTTRVWPLGLIVAGAIVWVVQRYASLCRGTLERVRVVEHANVAP